MRDERKDHSRDMNSIMNQLCRIAMCMLQSFSRHRCLSSSCTHPRYGNELLAICQHFLHDGLNVTYYLCREPARIASAWRSGLYSTLLLKTLPVSEPEQLVELGCVNTNEPDKLG